MRRTFFLFLFALGGCKTMSLSPAGYDCAEVDAARKRTLNETGRFEVVTLSRDQVILSSCGSASDRAALLELRSEGRPRLYRVEQWTLADLRERLPLDKSGVVAEAQRWCGNDSDCRVGVIVRDTEEAGMGGDGLTNRFATVYNCGVLHSAVGHYDFTFATLTALGLKREQARLSSLATQDVDEIEWFVAAAHAQVPNFRGGAFFETTPTVARARFIRWQQCQLKRLSDSCAMKRPVGEQFYWLGYGVHAVQDLVFHQGMSNAEHSFRDHALGEGVDCVEENSEAAAVQISTAVATLALERTPEDCRARMRDVLELPTIEAVRAQIGRPKDRVGCWLSEYFAEGWAFEDALAQKKNDRPRFQLNPRWFNAALVGDARTKAIQKLIEEIGAAPEGNPCDGMK